jgi:hypothetical protein
LVTTILPTVYWYFRSLLFQEFQPPAKAYPMEGGKDK